MPSCLTTHEQLQQASLCALSAKTAMLLALISNKRAGELTALFVNLCLFIRSYCSGAVLPSNLSEPEELSRSVFHVSRCFVPMPFSLGLGHVNLLPAPCEWLLVSAAPASSYIFCVFFV